MIPVLSVFASMYLMLNLLALTWLRFVAWMPVGLVLYTAHGARHSRVGNARGAR